MAVRCSHYPECDVLVPLVAAASDLFLEATLAPDITAPVCSDRCTEDWCMGSPSFYDLGYLLVNAKRLNRGNSLVPVLPSGLDCHTNTTWGPELKRARKNRSPDRIPLCLEKAHPIVSQALSPSTVFEPTSKTQENRAS
jgi:hypothetical protein